MLSVKSFDVLSCFQFFCGRIDWRTQEERQSNTKMQKINGIDFFKKEIERRTGFPMEKERTFEFTDRKDYYGWFQNTDNLWYYTPFIENGRVVDNEKVAMKTALYEIASTDKFNFRFS